MVNLGKYLPKKSRKRPHMDQTPSPTESTPKTPQAHTPPYGQPELANPDITPKSKCITTSLFGEIARPTWQRAPSAASMTADTGSKPGRGDAALSEHGLASLSMNIDHPSTSIAGSPHWQVEIKDMTDEDGSRQVTPFDSAEDLECIEEPGSMATNPASLPKHQFVPPPPVSDAKHALVDLTKLLRPHRPGHSKGYKHFFGDDLLRRHLEMMKMMLWHYTRDIDCCSWTKASTDAADAHDRGGTTTQSLQSWCRAYLLDRGDLLSSMYGTWNVSITEDEDLVSDVHLHLQGIGKHRKAMDIVHFFEQPDIQEQYQLDGWAPSLTTAQRWMECMEY
ncbi:hypothetical protein C8Q72DRAFT_891675 [Fomitopsis betulina]|nr:hypothetical protein C8Q72DRAFT_891675 [Fomitopsis betulina]